MCEDEIFCRSVKERAPSFCGRRAFSGITWNVEVGCDRGACSKGIDVVRGPTGFGKEDVDMDPSNGRGARNIEAGGIAHELPTKPGIADSGDGAV